MLDRGAPIPDHTDARRLRSVRCVNVAKTKLELHGGEPPRERVVDDVVEEFAPPEHVDEVDLVGAGDVGKAVVTTLAFDDRAVELRIHGDDPVAVAPQVRGHGVARSIGTEGIADDSDGPGGPEE